MARKQSCGSSTLWLLVAIAILVIVALGLFRFTSLYRTMSVTAAQSSELDSAAPGSSIQLVIEIANTPSPDRFRGKLLTKKTEEVYARTNTQASVHWNDQTKMVTGKSSDLHAGAVVHVTGTVRNDHRVDADQIVILTGYVRIE